MDIFLSYCTLKITSITIILILIYPLLGQISCEEDPDAVFAFRKFTGKPCREREEMSKV